MPHKLARWVPTGLALATALTACRAPAPPATLAAAAAAAASAAPVAPALAPGRISGQVLAPPGSTPLAGNAGVVSNNGAGVVQVNAAGLIGKVKYHLKSVADTALAGATVRLLDARGHAITGPDGRPATALTDATGHFTLQTAVPPGDVVLAVDLAGEAGTLQAVAPGGTADREARVDTASTLVADYVLDALLRPLADPQSALDRLDAELEAQTLARAAAALAAGEPPDSLRARDVLAAVQTLRGDDAAFDAQLEVVRQRLIEAGQLDLGNGRPATEASLGYLDTLVPGADGTLYLQCSLDRRVWALRPDGRLIAAAGSGTPSHDIEGRPAPEAGLLHIDGFDVDDRGRLVFLEADLASAKDAELRLSRREPDGTMHVLWQAPLADRTAAALAAGPGDTYWMVFAVGENGKNGGQLWRYDPNAGARQVGTFTPADGMHVAGTYVSGRDESGRIYLGTNSNDDWAAVYRLDPQAPNPALARLASGHDENLAGLTVDQRGNIYRLEHDNGRLALTRPDGTTRVVTESYPKGLKLWLDGAALMPDGTVFMGQTPDDGWNTNSLVYRLKDGGATRVAGLLPDAGESAAAGDAALRDPSGLAVLPDQDVLLADDETQRIMRLGADGRLQPYLGTGQAGHDDGPRQTATLSGPDGLMLDGQGNLYWRDVYQGYALRELSSAGVTSTLYRASGPDGYAGPPAVKPDGTLYFVTGQSGANGRYDVRVRPPGGPDSVLFSPQGYTLIALEPSGSLLYLTGNVLYRYAGASSPATRISSASELAHVYDLSVSPGGRIFALDRTHVYAIAADGGVTVVAGPDGKFFNGVGTDDSLLLPWQLAFPRSGDLLVADSGNRQVKRIPAGGY